MAFASALATRSTCEEPRTKRWAMGFRSSIDGANAYPSTPTRSPLERQHHASSPRGARCPRRSSAVAPRRPDIHQIHQSRQQVLACTGSALTTCRRARRSAAASNAKASASVEVHQRGGFLEDLTTAVLGLLETTGREEPERLHATTGPVDSRSTLSSLPSMSVMSGVDDIDVHPHP